MRYDNLPAFETFLEGKSLRQLPPFYLILGKDGGECQEAIDHLLHVLLPQEEREFALTTFDGTQVDEATLGCAFDSISFFARSQVIWIQQIDKTKKAIQETLEKALTSPRPGLYFLFSGISGQKSSAFYKTIEKEGVVLDLVELKPWEKEKRLIAWVNKQAAAVQKLISYQACQFLVKQVGLDQTMLSQEFEKLMCYCIDKKEIAIQDVEAICSQGYRDTIWQLGEAIFRRDSAAALHIGRTFLKEGDPFLPLLRQIRSQFQTDYQVCLLLSRGKQGDIALQFPYMKGNVLERHIQQAQHYGLQAFKEGLLAIDETEIKAKNSSGNETLLLELLIMQLTRRIDR